MEIKLSKYVKLGGEGGTFSCSRMPWQGSGRIETMQSIRRGQASTWTFIRRDSRRQGFISLLVQLTLNMGGPDAIPGTASTAKAAISGRSRLLSIPNPILIKDSEEVSGKTKRVIMHYQTRIIDARNPKNSANKTWRDQSQISSCTERPGHKCET